MRNLFLTGWVGLAALLVATSAQAAIWTEVGDAGQLPATAQIVSATVPTPLDAIIGGTSSPTDVDMYQIFISSPTLFSATTVGTPGTLVDTQLFLFDSTGRGVMANDDAAVGTLRSTLPSVAGGRPAGLGPLTPGIYYLAVTSFDNDPIAPGGLRIFPQPVPPFTGVQGPTGPGGALPISGWIQTAGTGAAGTYRVNITGADFVVQGVVIPEPGSLTLLGIGVAGLIGYGWRRRNRVA